MTGHLTLPGGGSGLQAATVTDVSARVLKTGDTMTGDGMIVLGSGTPEGSEAAKFSQIPTANAGLTNDANYITQMETEVDTGTVALNNTDISLNFPIGMTAAKFVSLSGSAQYFVDYGGTAKISGTVIFHATNDPNTGSSSSIILSHLAHGGDNAAGYDGAKTSVGEVAGISATASSLVPGVAETVVATVAIDFAGNDINVKINATSSPTNVELVAEGAILYI